MNATISKPAAWYQSRLRLLGWGSALALLSVPAIAMWAGADGVLWTASDFIVFALMLLILGTGIELSMRRSNDLSYRLGAIAACGIGFLTIWADLAVGMIGSEDNGYNLIFLAIVLFAAIGAALVRGNARLMSKLTFAAGAAQLVTAAIGYSADPRGAVFSMAFAVPWFVAGALFGNAAKRA